jgi:hypothetical protein
MSRSDHHAAEEETSDATDASTASANSGVLADDSEAAGGDSTSRVPTYGGLRARLQHLRTLGWAAVPEVDDATRKLALAMGLPLVDGVFASVVLSGSLASPSALIVTGLTVFGGPWMLAILIGEMAGDDVRVRRRRVLLVAALVVPAAGLEAVLAPTIASLLHMGVFHLFSAGVILSVGAMIANDDLAAYLPAPRRLVAVGLVCSLLAAVVSPGSLSPSLVVDSVLVGRAVAAAGLATLVALAAATAGPVLDRWLDVEAFKIGSGIALALVPLSIAGLLPSLASLAVFGLAVGFALDLPTESDPDQTPDVQPTSDD